MQVFVLLVTDRWAESPFIEGVYGTRELAVTAAQQPGWHDRSSSGDLDDDVRVEHWYDVEAFEVSFGTTERQ